MEPKYPDITVELIGAGVVMQALKRAEVSQQERDQFMTEATAGDYEHLLQTAMRPAALHDAGEPRTMNPASLGSEPRRS